ncbi:hypothetical protein [Tersicoccus sp. Bi-70]|uniref:hypothetical protein n=1 Tax=Tersicoccus sp. Bi-70 TaxID=1897634 RepID=UPI00097707E3|nr:hypothetical protein [Tersicoccus sp. Bi-70]OMH32564.1 hypothetical protein BGP79_07090 [Tersicoccus sp. Bi-70]
MATHEDLVMAALMGVIARHANRQGEDRAAAIETIRAAAVGRVDLLGSAAGTYKAAMADPTSGCWWAVAAMRLCVDAGADLDVARATVPIVSARLARADGGPASVSRHTGSG